VGQVIWSPAALDDVDAIAAYIARDSPYHAARFAQKLIDSTDRLTDWPRSGRVIPEIGDENRREIIVGAYRIMYRVEADNVWITGVVHGSRDWRP